MEVDMQNDRLDIQRALKEGLRRFFLDQLSRVANDEDGQSVLMAATLDYLQDVKRCCSMEDVKILFSKWAVDEELLVCFDKFTRSCSEKANTKDLEEVIMLLHLTLSLAIEELALTRENARREAIEACESLQEAEVQFELEMEKFNSEILILEQKLQKDKEHLRPTESDVLKMENQLAEARSTIETVESALEEGKLIYHMENKIIEKDRVVIEQKREQLEAQESKKLRDLSVIDQEIVKTQNLESDNATTQMVVKNKICQQTQSVATLLDKKRLLEVDVKRIQTSINDHRQLTNDLAVRVKSQQLGVMENESDLLLKRAELAWNRFFLDLSRSAPPYDLVKQRRAHRLFNIQDANRLVRETLSTFGQPRSLLTEEVQSYLSRNSNLVIEKVIEFLSEIVSKPKWDDWQSSNQSRTVSGQALILDEIFRCLDLPRLTEIRVYASRVIFVDTDSWETPGVNVILSSPVIQVVGSSSERLISTSGENAREMSPSKSNNGSGPGLSGTNGQPGAPGESAGHVTIKCNTFSGKLRVKANGGNGAKGQDGGDGANGSDGSNGRDASTPSNMENDTWYLAKKTKFFIKTGIAVGVGIATGGVAAVGAVAAGAAGGAVGVTTGAFVGTVGGGAAVGSTIGDQSKVLPYNRVYTSLGSLGTAGRLGGNGGGGGPGGSGGLKGGISVTCETLTNGSYCARDSENGTDGLDGQPGSPGDGGSGGKNGRNFTRIFEPDDLSPIFKITGNWCDRWGNAEFNRVYDGDHQIGHQFVNWREPGRAANGERGQRGQNAGQQLRRSALVKQAISNVSTSHWNRATQVEDVQVTQVRQAEEAVRRLESTAQTLRAEKGNLDSLLDQVRQEAFALDSTLVNEKAKKDYSAQDQCDQQLNVLRALNEEKEALEMEQQQFIQLREQEARNRDTITLELQRIQKDKEAVKAESQANATRQTLLENNFSEVNTKKQNELSKASLAFHQIPLEMKARAENQVKLSQEKCKSIENAINEKKLQKEKLLGDIDANKGEQLKNETEMGNHDKILERIYAVRERLEEEITSIKTSLAEKNRTAKNQFYTRLQNYHQ